MSEKRMLIVPAELAKRVDDNRGDLSVADFINYLIDSHLGSNGRSNAAEVNRAEIDALKQELAKLLAREPKYASKEELQSYQEDTKKLLKSFVDFFIGYGLEFGKDAPGEMNLREFARDAAKLERETEDEGSREVKLKWK